jgi:uncharacterized protein (TIGR02145 family)
MEDSFVDTRDGKTYKTIKIGEQIWMAENLAYKASSGCWAYDYDDINMKKYGYLYDLETAKKVCPAGWHLPSKSEWKKLIDYLGGENIAGGKLKEKEFSSLFGGFMSTSFNSSSVSFYNLGDFGCWWSATKFGFDYNVYSYYLSIFASHDQAVLDDSIECNGFSVRCIKD